jgi:hypothetical protein
MPEANFHRRSTPLAEHSDYLMNRHVRQPLLFRFVESGVESGCAWLEVDPPREGGRFGSALDAVHPDILPLDGKGPGVADVVEGHDDFFEVDVAPAHGTEVPVTPGVAEIGVSAENACRAVAVPPPGVLHVNVVDAVGEPPDEADIVNPLVTKMAGVVVEAETPVPADGGQSSLRRGCVECDLGRVDFEPEVHIHLFENLEDWQPAVGKIFVSGFQIFLGGGRKRVERMPDRRAGEAVDDRVDDRPIGSGVEKLPGGPRRGFHLFRRAAADALRVAVPPDRIGEDRLVAVVDPVADRLPDEMVGDGVASQSVACQLLPEGGDVFIFAEGAAHFEVRTPTGQLDPVVAHLFDER